MTKPCSSSLITRIPIELNITGSKVRLLRDFMAMILEIVKIRRRVALFQFHPGNRHS